MSAIIAASVVDSSTTVCHLDFHPIKQTRKIVPHRLWSFYQEERLNRHHCMRLGCGCLTWCILNRNVRFVANSGRLASQESNVGS